MKALYVFVLLLACSAVTRAADPEGFGLGRAPWPTLRLS